VCVCVCVCVFHIKNTQTEIIYRQRNLSKRFIKGLDTVVSRQFLQGKIVFMLETCCYLLYYENNLFMLHEELSIK
jgi:hypothetical protein